MELLYIKLYKLLQARGEHAINKQLFYSKAQCPSTFIVSKPDKYGQKFWKAADLNQFWMRDKQPDWHLLRGII